jgi:hypothetical protein
MGKRIFITEQEKKDILTQYNLLNENILISIANKLSGTKLYKLVDRLWDSNPINFVQNIIKEIPNIKNKQSELLQKITNISKMDGNQKLSFVNNNKGSVEKELINGEKTLTEQVVLWYSIGAIVFIYCLIGIVRMEKMRKSNPEKYNDIKNPPISLTDDETSTKELSDIIGKTVNLYNTSDERDLYKRIKIIDIKFKSQKTSTGYVEFRTKSETYLVGCLTNPDRLATNVQKMNTVSDYYYNNKFTTLLDEKVGHFCKKPSADFSSIPNKDIDPSKMG